MNDIVKQKTKIILVGCGGISAAWFNGIKGSPHMDLVGLIDLNEQMAKEKAKEFGFHSAKTGSDLASMIQSTGAEVVFDCTVPSAHRKVTLTALENGCHVLGEKPLSENMQYAREMVNAAGKAGKLYAVMQNRRYLKDIRRIREFIASGVIGKVHTVHSDFFLGPHFGGFREEMKHVLILDMGIHTFDAARYISGVNPTEVICHEWNPEGSWYEHDASAVAIFKMTDGVVYTYRGSWCAQGLGTTWEAHWRIIGTKGSILWDGGENMKAELVNSDDWNKNTPVDIPPLDYPKESEGHFGCIQEFIDCVQNGGTPLTICTDNLLSLAMVHGAIESAEKRTWIKLNP